MRQDLAFGEPFKCQFNLVLVGDALGIYPRNNPPEVKRLLDAMHCKGTKIVDKPSFAYTCDHSYGKKRKGIYGG